MKKIFWIFIVCFALPLFVMAEDIKITPPNQSASGHPTFEVSIDDALDNSEIGSVVLPFDFVAPGQENTKKSRALKTSKEISSQVKARASQERLDDIFSQEIAKGSNIFVDPELEGDVLVFHLSKPNGEPIYKSGMEAFPVLDFYGKNPIVFHVKNGQVSLNSENGKVMIDSSALLSEFAKDKFEPFARISVRSPMTSRLYNAKLMFFSEGAIMQFKWSNEITTLPIKTDFKVLDQNMFVLDGEKEIPVKIFPVDIKDLVATAAEKNKGLAVKDFELDSSQGRGFYRVRFQEPIKYFGFISGALISEIQFDVSGANASQVKRPWYAMFGSTLDLAQTFSFTKKQ